MSFPVKSLEKKKKEKAIGKKVKNRQKLSIKNLLSDSARAESGFELSHRSYQISLETSDSLI